MPGRLLIEVSTVILDDQNYRSRHCRAIGRVQGVAAWVIRIDVAGPLQVIRGAGIRVIMIDTL